MGRETKILLALLATLAGVFLGVLSMKLLVPRPPIGAGPDVHVDVADTEQHELVDPPSPSPSPASSGPAAGSHAAGGASFADAGPLVPPRAPDRGFTPETGDLLPPPMALEPPVSQSPGTSPATAEIAASEPASAAAVPAAPPRRDPFVAPAGLQMPITQQPVSQQPITQQPVGASEPPAEPLPTSAAAYMASPGDSWWGLAERAYGDGRLYRALFAWNRVIDPRVSLAPGTRLEIPSRARLEAAWPKLMPAK
jgi:nucleoid-associated protein YgaU